MSDIYLKEEAQKLEDRIETWRPVVGYEGRYEVSDEGRVRSLNYRGNTGLVVVMKSRPNQSGYHLCSIGVYSTKAVHKMVAEAFLGPCESGMEVNHKDGNKDNNSLSNLEYITHGENMRHAYKMGLVGIARGERAGLSKLTEDQVREIRKLHISGRTYKSIASEFGVTFGLIGHIVTRRIWKHVH